MRVSDIVSGVNTKLAGETLTLNQMRLFLNECIDDINADLSAKFPSFDGMSDGDDYTAIPDNYIRSVIIPGAAYKFYVTDEEGSPIAMRYQYDYLDRKFLMLRDFAERVPEEYVDTDKGYVIDDSETFHRMQGTWRGWGV